MDNNRRSTSVMDVKTYETTIRNTQKKLEKARERGEISRCVMLEKKIYDVKKQFTEQKFSVEQAFPDNQVQNEILEHIVAVTVVSDILSGLLTEMKSCMEKNRVFGGDAYDNACAAVRLSNTAVRKLEECGNKSTLALSYFTEKIESKYMLGMTNDIRQMIRNGIVWKKCF